MSGMLGCLGMQVQRLSHIGICVTDLEASVAFYRDALGFSELSRLEVSGSEAERLLELIDSDLSDEERHAEALRLLRTHPAMAEARAYVVNLAGEAKGLLKVLPEGSVRSALETFADLVATRTA